MLQLHLQNKYFQLIQKEKKLIEGRLGKEKYLSLKEGDLIEFLDSVSQKNLICKVEKVIHYPTFEKMLQEEELSKILPGEDSLENGVLTYREFYSLEEEMKYGVVAIFIKLNSKN